MKMRTIAIFSIRFSMSFNLMIHRAAAMSYFYYYLGWLRYPPVTNDEVFKEIFEQAENFKKYAG
jgi:hypothetical protein